MANFGTLILTNKGRELIAKSIVEGFDLQYLYGKVGDGIWPDNIVPELLEDLISPKGIAKFLTYPYIEDNVIHCELVFDNTNVTEGFYLREFGIFVRDENGEEVLFAVAYDDEPTYIPPSSSMYFEERFELKILISNTSDVKIKVAPSNNFVVADDFNRLVNICNKYGIQWNEGSYIPKIQNCILYLPIADEYELGTPLEYDPLTGYYQKALNYENVNWYYVDKDIVQLTGPFQTFDTNLLNLPANTFLYLDSNGSYTPNEVGKYPIAYYLRDGIIYTFGPIAKLSYFLADKYAKTYSDKVEQDLLTNLANVKSELQTSIDNLNTKLDTVDLNHTNTENVIFSKIEDLQYQIIDIKNIFGSYEITVDSNNAETFDINEVLSKPYSTITIYFATDIAFENQTIVVSKKNVSLIGQLKSDGTIPNISFLNTTISCTEGSLTLKNMNLDIKNLASLDVFAFINAAYAKIYLENLNIQCGYEYLVNLNEDSQVYFKYVNLPVEIPVKLCNIDTFAKVYLENYEPYTFVEIDSNANEPKLDSNGDVIVNTYFLLDLCSGVTYSDLGVPTNILYKEVYVGTPEETVYDSNATTDSNSTTTDSNSSTTDSNSTTTDSNSSTTDSNDVTTDSNSSTIDSNSTTTDSNA